MLNFGAAIAGVEVALTGTSISARTRIQTMLSARLQELGSTGNLGLPCGSELTITGPAGVIRFACTGKVYYLISACSLAMPHLLAILSQHHSSAQSKYSKIKRTFIRVVFVVLPTCCFLLVRRQVHQLMSSQSPASAAHHLLSCPCHSPWRLILHRGFTTALTDPCCSKA